ncbi:protein PHLOEM PROTEIN 2-LIKE A10-like [Gossypium raimondii]|uniref:Protein PHLOEM PROTEIN 2-LIKE A10-like n=1 Tax=Gossypium hirsutum TaxID=3635 RepID=A0A1U8J0U3_GOSHI|nr:protein PHLOEM PROTEIN 2-LIKE A10-like [Gossypium raimondii]XP_016683977.1 protein PHLOEM PROTEIN 2-LIKE A10-like [Gossypium hirsutum]
MADLPEKERKRGNETEYAEKRRYTTNFYLEEKMKNGRRKMNEERKNEKEPYLNEGGTGKSQKRNRVLKLLRALVSITEAVSDRPKAIRVVSSDLNGFLQSELDQIPNSLKQVSKITRSNEFSQSIAM